MTTAPGNNSRQVPSFYLRGIKFMVGDGGGPTSAGLMLTMGGGGSLNLDDSYSLVDDDGLETRTGS